MKVEKSYVAPKWLKIKEIWCLVENAGLLREVAWKEEKMDRKGETYHDLYLEQQNRDEFDIPENEPSNEDLESINLEKLMRND